MWMKAKGLDVRQRTQWMIRGVGGKFEPSPFDLIPPLLPDVTGEKPPLADDDKRT